MAKKRPRRKPVHGDPTIDKELKDLNEAMKAAVHLLDNGDYRTINAIYKSAGILHVHAGSTLSIKGVQKAAGVKGADKARRLKQE